MSDGSRPSTVVFDLGGVPIDWDPRQNPVRTRKVTRVPVRNTEIYLMNADGSGQRNLTRNPAPDDDPAWSPDGRKIAFVGRRDGKPEVYVMNADGSGRRNLTRNPGRDRAPAWSPDGRTIAFQSERDRNLEIYVMNT